MLLYSQLMTKLGFSSVCYQINIMRRSRTISAPSFWFSSLFDDHFHKKIIKFSKLSLNPLNAELNPIYYLLEFTIFSTLAG